MNQRTKSILLLIAKFAIPAAIISWCVSKVKPEQWQLLQEQPKNYSLLVAALLVALTALSLSYFRWCLLVRCQGISLAVIEAFRLGAIGFLLSFVSAGSVGGDLFKAVFLAKRSPGKRVEAIASVVVDRGVGLLGLLLLVTIALSVTEPRASAGEDGAIIARVGQAAGLLTVVGLTVIGILILGGKPIDGLIRWSATWPFVGGLIERIAGPLRMFHQHPFAFGVSLLISVGVHVLLTLSIYMIANGLFSEPPSLADHFVIVQFANTAAALPIAPAGLGVTELAVDWLYRVIPETPTTASGTLVALVYELVKVAMAIIGMIFYWTAGREVKSSLSAAEEVNTNQG